METSTIAIAVPVSITLSLLCKFCINYITRDSATLKWRRRMEVEGDVFRALSAANNDRLREAILPFTSDMDHALTVKYLRKNWFISTIDENKNITVKL